MTEHGEALSEAVKSVLIFVLTVIMLVLLTLLMLGQDHAGTEDVLPYEEHMVVYETPASMEELRGMAAERVTPSVIAWRVEGKDTLHGLFADTGNRESACAPLLPMLGALFGENSLCTVIPAEESAEVWENSRRAALLYLRFPGSLPASVLGAYARGSGDEENGGLSDELSAGGRAYLRELLLLADEKDPSRLCAVVRDENGAAARFSFDGTAAALPEELHTAALSAYIENAENGYPYREAVFCAEAENIGTENGGLILLRDASSGGDTALFVTSLISVPDITVSRPGGDAFFTETPGSTLSALLGLFGMRTNEVSNYKNASDARVYVDAGGSLTVGTDGSLSYSALQTGGLSLSDFLGYSSITDSYSLTETLYASDRLLLRLGEMHPACRGGDAELCLVSVSGTENSVTFTYDCRMAGLSVQDAGNTPFCTVTAEGGVITELTLYPVEYRISGGEDARLLLPQSVVLDAIAEERKRSASDDGSAEETVSGILALVYRRTEGETFAAEWVFRQTETDAGTERTEKSGRTGGTAAG